VALLTPETHAVVLRLASLPERVRGFGHAKEVAVQQFRSELQALMLELECSVEAGSPLRARAI